MQDRFSVGELFKQLSNDASHLVRQEVQLVKVEMRESLSRMADAGVKLAIALVLLAPGLLAITAAIVIGLGLLIGSYWVSALIVGVVVLAIAGLMVQRAVAELKTGLAPRETIETVNQDVHWAQREGERVKQRLSA